MKSILEKIPKKETTSVYRERGSIGIAGFSQEEIAKLRSIAIEKNMALSEFLRIALREIFLK